VIKVLKRLGCETKEDVLKLPIEVFEKRELEISTKTELEKVFGISIKSEIERMELPTRLNNILIKANCKTREDVLNFLVNNRGTRGVGVGTKKELAKIFVINLDTKEQVKKQ
jgi:hypothetical protein